MRTSLLALAAAACALVGASMDELRMGAQSVNAWHMSQIAKARALEPQDTSQQPLVSLESVRFPARWFRQPVDHFDASRKETFLQRYWVSTRHYKAGGPVIVLDGGETSGENRLPFLDTGIVDILAKATNGVGVVLEHRYYGRSLPVLNFTTDALRFLNNNQSAADSAAFMAGVSFIEDGINADLTAPATPWIYYGGSYAGARAAHMRVLYPELTYGAIASSAVTHAAIVYWEYFEVIRRAAPQDCIARIESSIAFVDRVLAVPLLRTPLKRLFGLADLEHDDDFASVLETAFGGWQGRNWDPAVSSTRFENFCAALAGDGDDGDEDDDGDEALKQLRLELSNVPGSILSSVMAGPFDVPVSVINYAKFIRARVERNCPEGYSTEECFGTYDEAKYQDVSVASTWRLWMYQVCTEWGYFMTTPPDPSQRRIISKHITLEYASKICKMAYKPGKHFKLPELPDVEGAVNSLGDFALKADRLAFIDGTSDPWMPATPHSWYAPNRTDTVLQPFKEIQDAVHHWDENGLANPEDEPPRIQKIHREEVEFVRAWLADFDKDAARASAATIKAALAQRIVLTR